MPDWTATWAGWAGASAGSLAVIGLVCWPRPTLYALGVMATVTVFMAALLWSLGRTR